MISYNRRDFSENVNEGRSCNHLLRFCQKVLFSITEKVNYGSAVSVTTGNDRADMASGLCNLLPGRSKKQSVIAGLC